MSLQEALLNALKDRFKETAGTKEFGGCASASQKPYYLARLEDNLVVPMNESHIAEYSRGSGGELDGKMKSLRSSSAMTFNLLGNGPIALYGTHGLPAGTYSVEFEHQLPTLANNPRPANLDAKLEHANASTIIYCEMKLAEWILGKASMLRKQYLEPDSYLIPETPATVFVKAFASLCQGTPNDDGTIAPKLSRYDAFQMMKHTLAIYTEMHRRMAAQEPLPKRIILLNCVWEMTNPSTLGRYESTYRARETEEHEQYRVFKKTIMPIVQLFAGLGIGFEAQYLSFEQMRDAMDLSRAHRQALERYIV